MKTKRWVLVSIAVFGMMLFVAMTTGKEKAEKMTELPSLVMAAIQSLFPSAEVAKIKMEEEGVKVYDVDLKSGDNVSITKDGTVVSVSSQVATSNIPAVVAAAIAEKAKDAKVLTVEKEETKAELQLVKLAAPKVTYEAKVELNGKVLEIKIDAAGKVLGMEADEGDQGKHEEGDDEEDGDDDEKPVTLDSLSDVVKAAIVKAAEGGDIKKIVSEDENGQVAYEAEVVIGGQEFEIKVAPDGKVIEKKAEKEGDGDKKGHDKKNEKEDKD
jgi:hypothetical protein